MNIECAAKQLEALGNPTRLSIYKILIEWGSSGCAVGDIQKQLSIPASTLSHHIAKLVSTGLVLQVRESRTLICKANDQNMDALLRFIMENCRKKA